MSAFDEAEQVAARELDRQGEQSGIDLGFVPGATKEVDEGWFFFWTSRAWLESGDFDDQLAGNGPFFVSRETGELHQLWTAEPWETQLDRYRNTGRFVPDRRRR